MKSATQEAIPIIHTVVIARFAFLCHSHGQRKFGQVGEQEGCRQTIKWVSHVSCSFWLDYGALHFVCGFYKLHENNRP